MHTAHRTVTAGIRSHLSRQNSVILASLYTSGKPSLSTCSNLEL